MAELASDAPVPDQRKWKIVGGLAIVLVVVVWLQFDSGEDPAQIGLVPKAKRPEIAQATARNERPWPRFELSEVLKQNPFQGLKSEDEKKVEALEPVAAVDVDPTTSALAAFQARRVRAIFVTKKGPAAMLDNELVHEGDIVNGIRIVSIRADGLVVEAAESNTPPAERERDASP